MKVTVCDICGKVVSNEPVHIEFYSDHHHIYEKLDVHKECYENLINEIKERKGSYDLSGIRIV